MTGDVELVHLAQAGDGGALGVLLERHRARLYASALAILGEREAAQDAVQEACLAALLRIQDLRDPRAVAGWLHVIVRNACRMRLRAHRELTGVEVFRAVDGSLDVDEALAHLALRDWLWTALDALPGDLQATVMLRYFTRHAAYGEIAAILGIPVGTVRSRLHQAKQRLADSLLASAATVHPDHTTLVNERLRWWAAVIAQIEREESAALYVADSSTGALVEAPALGYLRYGAADQGQGMIETARAGVRVHLTGVVASEGVSIAEFSFENPGHDPQHCPPSQTEVRFHPDGPATRIILYYGEHDASDAHPSSRGTPPSEGREARPLRQEGQ